MTAADIQTANYAPRAPGIDGKSPSESGVRHMLPSALLHDLRTPLTQILGYSQMMMEQAQQEDNASFALDLKKVCTAGRQLVQIIDDNFGGVATPALDDGALRAECAARPEPEQAVEGPSAVAPGGVPTASPEQGIVLVVDDNAANRDVLSSQLECQGYTVVAVESGRLALETVRARPFDVVLLDILMPEMDGYQVLQELKADEALHHLPVIVISALTELDSVVRCIDMGADDYLTKPFDSTLLRARVGSCLGKKRAHDRETRISRELQASYGRLQHLERLRDDLTHMIVHDLRTPLTSVIVGMQTLEVIGTLNELQQEVIGIGLDSGQTLLGMINDLLDVDKMESGSMQLDYAPLSATDLVVAAVRQVGSLAKASDMTVAEDISADLPPIQGDEEKLRRVLVNLLGNAIKFSPAGGTVTVEARKADDGESVRFSVRDTGEGIPPEAYGRIFEKFGQVESRHAGRKMATGLGLAFCKLAIEAHGGRIWVSSRLGKGSTFRFVVPVQRQQA